MASATDLQPLLAAAQSFVPGLGGRIGVPAAGQVVPGADNRDAVRRLVAGIADAYPEGGRAYWAVRAWGMLTWQPAVLALLAVHRCGLAPRLDALGQCAVGSGVFGFTLPPGDVGRGAVPDLIAVAGGRLRWLADVLLADLRMDTSMKPVLAGRLLADRVLGTLVRVSPAPDRHADAWLAAMRLEGQSGLVPLTLADGQCRHGLDRRACCLAYRVGEGRLCSTCPRLPAVERHALMRKEWETHVPAQ